MVEQKTTKEIIEIYKNYAGLNSMLVKQESIDNFYDIKDVVWLREDEL